MSDATPLPPETLAALGGDELRARVFLEEYALRDLDDRLLETLPQQMWDRVARELAGVEPTPELQERWRREFRWLLDGFRFLPGGRILHGAGNPKKVTLLNCLHGDTPVLVKRGDDIVRVPIRELASTSEEHLVLTQDGAWRPARFYCYGVQPLYEVTLATRETILATPAHEWVTADTGARVTTANLKGRRIPLSLPAKPDTDDPEVLEGIRHGIAFGDGSRRPTGLTEVYLFGKKKALAGYFDRTREHYAGLYTRAATLPASYKTLPDDSASAKHWYGFILGLIATDGFVDGLGSTGITQSSLEVVLAIARNAPRAGFMPGQIHILRDKSPFGDQYGPCYVVRLRKRFMRAEDFIREDQRASFLAKPSTRGQSARVTDVRPTGREDLVYCCVEPETHTFTIGNGVLTGQCYFTGIRGDSLEEIYAAAYRAAKTYSRGGGIGIDVTPLRPAGAPVHNAARSSTGAVSFMELFSLTTGLIGQSGRRGALMITIADHHPDVLEFCRVKRNLTSVRYANISVRLSDAFMRAVEQDGPWTLWFEGPETGRIERTIRARELWDELTTGARDWAEPGCLFWDRVIGYGTSNYGGMTPQGTNPCLVGSTRIATSEGLVTIADLAARPGALPGAVLDTRVGRAPGRIIRAWKTGRKAVVRIETREGYQLRATPDHKILTENRGWVRAGDLAAGDVLLVQNRKGGFGARGTRELGLALGWLVADGAIDKLDNRAILQFYGDKRALASVLQGAVASCVAGASTRPAPAIIASEPSGRDEVKSRRLLNRLVEEGFDPSSKHRIPELIWQGTEDTVRGFLQAVFTADGTVLDASQARKSLRLSSANLEFLRDVQLLLANFGVASRIYAERQPAARVPMPDGRGGLAPYQRRAAHELVIGKSNIAAFAREIGFLAPSPKQRALDALVASYTRGPYRERFTARVLRVVSDGEEDVYDLHEATRNAFTANAITVHNCSEIPLEDGGACNLGSLNLAAFVVDPFAPAARLDTDALDRAVRAAIRFLDNVLTYNEGKHALPEQEEAARRGRRVGLGIAGLGDALVMLGLRYDSPEAIRAAGDIMRRIKETAYRASVELAREKGPFPAFDADLHLAQAFFATFPQDLLDDIRRHGLRNVSLLTIPPTGSISAMAGITNGLEPIFALSYVRRSESLSQEFFHVLHPLVRAYLDRAGQALDPAELARASDPHAALKERLPAAFVTAHEIDPLRRVDMQAALQAHIDQSISSTVNLPRDATTDTVARVYFHAWRSGLKGISVYREGSREGVLLTPEEARRQHRLVALADTVRTTALAAAPDLQLDGGSPEEQIERAVRLLAERLRAAPVQLSLDASAPDDILVRRPRSLPGFTYRVPSHLGTLFVTINELDGQPVEVFCRLGKGGSDSEADSEMAGRLISFALRLHAPSTPFERLERVREQLEGIGGATASGFGPNRVRSIADAIAKAIGWYIEEKRASRGAAAPAAEPEAEPQRLPAPIAGGGNGNLCPQCHTYSLITDQGCTKCRQCSYKEC